MPRPLQRPSGGRGLEVGNISPGMPPAGVADGVHNNDPPVGVSAGWSRTAKPGRIRLPEPEYHDLTCRSPDPRRSFAGPERLGDSAIEGPRITQTRSHITAVAAARVFSIVNDINPTSIWRMTIRQQPWKTRRTLPSEFVCRPH